MVKDKKINLSVILGEDLFWRICCFQWHADDTLLTSLVTDGLHFLCAYINTEIRGKAKVKDNLYISAHFVINQ